MDDQTLKQIAEMVSAAVDVRLVRFRGEIQDDIRQFSGEVISRFDRAVGAVEDAVQHKLDLLVEGQQAMVERMDRFEGRMDGIEQRMDRIEVRVTAVEKKVDGVAADLTAHRRDTEAHQKGWRVREEQ